MPWHASTDVIECVRSRWRRADKNSGGGERWLKDKTVKKNNNRMMNQVVDRTKEI